MRRLNEKRTWSGRVGYIRLKALYYNPQCSIHAACGSAYLREHNIEKIQERRRGHLAVGRRKEILLLLLLLLYRYNILSLF